MSLKGYQWLDDNGEVIMSFMFKYLELDVWKDTTKKEFDKFVAFLKEHSFGEILKINYHDHKVE